MIEPSIIVATNESKYEMESFVQFLRDRSGLVKDMMDSTYDSDDDASLLQSLALTDEQVSAVRFLQSMVHELRQKNVSVSLKDLQCAVAKRNLLFEPQALLEALSAWPDMDTAVQVADFLLFETDFVQVLRFEADRRIAAEDIAVASSRLLITKVLSGFIQDVPALSAMLQKTGAVVAGGACLKAFHDAVGGVPWTDGDLDIFQYVDLPSRAITPLHPTWTFSDTVKIGAVAQLRESWQKFLEAQEAEMVVDTTVADDEYFSVRADRPGNNAVILMVQRFKSRSGRPIQIIFVRKPIHETVMLFDMNICKCTFDGCNLRSTHPYSVISRQALLKVPHFYPNTNRTRLRKMKYETRGYHITEFV